MILCQVVGTVVATAKHGSFVGHKLLIVQPEAPPAAAKPASFLAVDTVQAGPGDRVLVMREGNGVRQILGANAGPIRSLIVAIVDAVDISAGS